VRRVDRAAAEDHLAGPHDLSALELDAGCARPLEDDAVDERPAADLEVRAAHRRVEVCACRAHAPTPVECPVERGEALLPVAVDVVGQLVAGLLHRFEERGEER
jgi:hypothetical protein